MRLPHVCFPRSSALSDPTQPPGKTFEHVSPPLPVDDPAVFALLAGWAGDEATYRKILSDNPARLYDF